MKKLNLNIQIDDLDFGGKAISVADLVRGNVNQAIGMYVQQVQGLQIAQQRVIYKILDKLDAGIELELEDTEFAFLEKVYKETRFMGATKIIVRIADKIEEAKKPAA